MKNFSIIIPIYNEEKILKNQVLRIIQGINKLKLLLNYEIILVENGSTDDTCRIAKGLENEFKIIKRICLQFPSYGQAFKEGLKKAQYPYIFQFDIDFWDINFISKAQNLLEKYDFVIGSKNMNGSKDNRSIFRKLISKTIEKIIEMRFNTKLSDTHGLKALKKSIISGLIRDVKCGNHFLDSELLLRASAAKYTFTQLPVSLKELRQSRFPFYLRFAEVIKEFTLLMSIDLSRKNYTVLTNNYKLVPNN